MRGRLIRLLRPGAGSARRPPAGTASATRGRGAAPVPRADVGPAGPVGGRLPSLLAGLVAAAVGLAACGGGATQRPVVLVATTTTYDAGLLDALAAAFEQQHPDLSLKVVAVGTGEALALGRRGDADVLLVHDPPGERAFVERGHGVRRVPVMRNAFVLVGPPSDPAGAASADSLVEAFRAIARSRTPFASRGDDSGTHRREREVWRAAGVDPAGDWYRELGQGMAETLRYASERGAYTLSVSANFHVLRDQLALQVLVDEGPRRENVYSVIPVADPPHPSAARRLVRWLTGPGARGVIASFGRERHGRPLFRPVRRDTTARSGGRRAGPGAP